MADLNQAFGAVERDLGGAHVLGDRLVKGGGDHFAFHGAVHVGHFFRALADQADHQVDLFIVLGDGVGDLLENSGFTSLGGETTMAPGRGRWGRSGRSGD